MKCLVQPVVCCVCVFARQLLLELHTQRHFGSRGSMFGCLLLQGQANVIKLLTEFMSSLANLNLPFLLINSG